MPVIAMKMFDKTIQRALLAAALAACAVAARGDSVNLVGGGNLIWNIDANPTASPSVTFQIQNTAASSNRIFNGYDLGLQVTLLGGSGQIASGSVSNPASNSIVPAWYFSTPVGGADLSSNSVYNLAYDDALDFPVPDTPTNLVTVNFRPGANPPAPGSSFQILSDDSLSDYVNHSGNSTPYANNATGNFVLDTITVTPEPSSLVLLGVAAGGFAIHYARRRRRGSHRTEPDSGQGRVPAERVGMRVAGPLVGGESASADPAILLLPYQSRSLPAADSEEPMICRKAA